MDTETTTAGRVIDAMNLAERTQKWTADKSGIAISTFRRKLNGGADFTISEVTRIARSLGVKPWTLLPSEFQCGLVAA